MLKFKKFSIYIISVVTCAALFACAIVFSACSQKAEEPISFAFDSWETLSKVAEGGIDHLKDVYKPTGGTFVIQDLDDDNEVLAKTRQIYIEGVGKYLVRVIGEAHDVCNNNKTSALTFEFCDLIGEVPYTLVGSYSNDWEKSELRNYLNQKFFDSLPSDLRGVIKTVKKDTALGGTKDVKTYDEKIFPLSTTEINVAKSYNQKEGEPYKFYVDHAYMPNNKKDPRHRDKKTYWLRSPMSENTICDFVIRYDDDDKFYSENALEDVLNRLPVAPCFCI